MERRKAVLYRLCLRTCSSTTSTRSWKGEAMRSSVMRTTCVSSWARRRPVSDALARGFLRVTPATRQQGEERGGPRVEPPFSGCRLSGGSGEDGPGAGRAPSASEDEASCSSRVGHEGAVWSTWSALFGATCSDDAGASASPRRERSLPASTSGSATGSVLISSNNGSVGRPRFVSWSNAVSA